jgi:hypothetical protein
MKTTDWFPPEVFPVHNGVYEVKPGTDPRVDGGWYRMYENGVWYGGFHNPDEAAKMRSPLAARFISEWRGVVK